MDILEGQLFSLRAFLSMPVPTGLEEFPYLSVSASKLEQQPNKNPRIRLVGGEEERTPHALVVL